MTATKKTLALLLALILVFACLTGCKKEGAKEPSGAVDPGTDNGTTAEPAEVDDGVQALEGGVIKLSIASDPDSLMAHRVRLGVLSVLPIYEALLTYDENGEPVPYLAKSITPNVEDLSYAIELNEGILFHDGSELTAEVCKWNLIKYRDEGILGASYLSYLADVEVTGDYSLTLKLSQWDSQLPYALARQMGYMQSQLAFETHGEEYMAEHPVGTGPFVFDSWQHGVSLKFVRNENYWNGDVALDGVELVIYSEAMTAQAAIEAGELDVWTATDYKIATELEEEGFTVYASSVPYLSYAMFFHCLDGPFADIRVRQAVAYALNREEICSILTAEKAEITNQFVPPDSPYYNDAIEGYSYNIEKAKELLTEAGYPNGFDTTITTFDTASQNNVCLIIIEQLKKIGINVEMIDLDVATYTVTMNGWQSGMFFKSITLDSGVASQISGGFLPGRENGMGVGSFPQPDDLADAIKLGSATSGQDSINAFQEAAKLIVDDYCIGVFFAVNRKVTVTQTNVHDTGWGAISTYGATLGKAWLSAD